MQLTTSVKSIDTSLPTVMLAITFFTASFFFSRLGFASSCRSSCVSPAHSVTHVKRPSPRSPLYIDCLTFLGRAEELGVVACASHALGDRRHRGHRHGRRTVRTEADAEARGGAVTRGELEEYGGPPRRSPIAALPCLEANCTRQSITDPALFGQSTADTYLKSGHDWWKYRLAKGRILTKTTARNRH